MYIAIIGIGAFLLLLLFIFVSTYNSIVRRENAVQNAFSSVDIMLKKRLELVPQLAKAVSHYMEYEKEVIKQIEGMQERYLAIQSHEEKVEADNAIQLQLMDFHSIVKKNNTLASSSNMMQLQHTLVETEEHISAARRFYNTAVTEYNNKILSFPGNYIALWRKIKPKQVFSIPKFDRISPEIEKML